MVKMNQTKIVPVEAKTLCIFMKVRDEFCATLRDADGHTLHEQDHDYVPDFMPDGGDDYLCLDIDIDTGQITNWKVPTTEQLEKFCGKEDD